MGYVKGKEEKATIFEDSIISGLLLAKGHQVVPQLLQSGKVVYEVSGDVEKSLNEIYANVPINSLDVLKGIKFARSCIFNLKVRR